MKESISANNGRIIKNSLFLYVRLILTLCITLYTSRTVLFYLGVEDYGIYNVVGGIVTMMSFLSGAMASASQRFLSYEIGKEDKFRLHRVFKTSVNIHLMMVMVVILIAETIGLKVVNSILVIPIDRVNAANIVYQCAVFSFCCTLLSVPYIATILANEHMKAFAYLGLFDVTFKLVIVFILGVDGIDNLELYACLSALVSFIMFLVYYSYCVNSFEASKYSWYWDKELFKEIINYTGWNLFGNLASVFSMQAINVLLNIFFGPAVNAARAVSFQVHAAIMGFVTSLQMSINPQIIKSFSANKIEYMNGLVILGSKYSFLLIYLLSLPVLLQTNYILHIWLVKVPPYTAIFCKLILVDALVVSLSGPLMTAFQATGHIKIYQICVGGLLLLNLPISYVLLNYGFDSFFVVIVSIALSVVALITRLFLLTKVLSFDIVEFTQKVIVKVIAVIMVTAPPMVMINKIDSNLHMKFILVVISSFTLVTVSSYFIALSKDEKLYLKSKFQKLKKILFKKQVENEYR